jgi:hypothetical protein
MAKRIKWIHEKTKYYHMDHAYYAFRLDDSKFIFSFGRAMLYNSFRREVSEFAEHYGATQIEVFHGELQEFEAMPFYILINSWINANGEYAVRYRKPIVDKHSMVRNYREYKESDIFEKLR